MKNPIEKLKELDAKFFDILEKDPEKAASIVQKIIFGVILSLMGGTILYSAVSLGLKAKENKDFINGKFNPSIKEANVLSVNKWTNTVKVDINGNEKFEKDDFSFFNYVAQVPTDSKSVVYIDGVGKKKPLAYKRENGEYIIYRDTTSYLKKSEDLNKEFYDYMSDKKVFDLVKAEREIKNHTR